MPDKLIEVVQFCVRKRKPLIVCADTNAHSKMWGGEEDNERGRMVEEFILDHGLEVLNRGSQKTFQSPVGSSVIDLTISTSDISHLVENWVVSDHSFSSDHYSGTTEKLL